ncbi:MAG: dTMP kinase [Candidatus Hatepunaea meridiana]|nr:dTMP kinase [Candidatus Hatepunaea meridiana]
MSKGKLITFEGIDGSGKSTQAGKIYAYLTSRNVECKLLREPGGTRSGDLIRSILLSSAVDNLEMNPYTEYLLFVASRAELSRTVIRPLLKEGCTVILDRFGDSSLAYQGYGNGVDVEFIRRTNGIATDGIIPDLTILFDIDPEIAMSRPGDFDDRIEKRGIDFFKRVRDGFLELAQDEPERFRIVDASKDIESVTQEVISIVNERILLL